MTRQKHSQPHCSIRPSRVPLRLCCPLPVLFALMVMLALDGTGILRIGLLCAALHEGGHLLAYCLLLHRLPVLEVRVTGLCLRMRGVFLAPAQELWLAAAGPMTNLACCSVALWLMQGRGSAHYAGYWFAGTNLMLGVFNLMPLPGLDGARILSCTADALRVCILRADRVKYNLNCKKGR